MAKRRNIRQRRKWMTRSYAVALVFLEVRCVDQIPWLATMTTRPSTLLETHGISDLWMYIALSLMGAELVLRSEKMLEKRASLKNAAAAAGATL
jgi:hypothetical protein